MLDLAEPSTPRAFDPRTVDDRSDAELDALPFGIIALDEDGVILRYNLCESRFARLDRNQVVGRNFFTEVAYCTRNEAFEGRFRTFVAVCSGGAQAEPVRFEFLFNFKFGAQHVTVELVCAAGAARFYLIITQREIAGPRPERPADQVGALQRELAPDEAQRGVLRDALERRFIDASAPFFAALRATCDRLALDTWQIFASEWGVQWGRRVAVDLEASALEKGERPLRELSMREVARLVSAYFAERGWGLITFDFAPAAEGVLVVTLERSALAEAAPRALHRGSAPVADLDCHLVAGCLAAILSSVTGRRLAGREVACVAAGAQCCSILVVGHERRGAIDTAVSAGTRGVESIRGALRRAPRSPVSAR